MRYLTSGESHGPQLTAILEGVPAGLKLSVDDINIELSRRQQGYGRGRRMQIEKDKVEILSGVRHGKTLGSPITLVVKNNDWKNWTKVMGIEPLNEDEQLEIKRRISRPRPGHADLNGAIKYGHRDMRNVLERSSARETTIRVAAGAVAKKILNELGIQVASHVLKIGKAEAGEYLYENINELIEKSDKSPVRCYDSLAEKKMIAEIDAAKKDGDSIGGIVEVIAEGLPVGLGSYVHYDHKLDAKIAASIMSINAFKGVEFGLGFSCGDKFGSEVHDEILWDNKQGYTRRTNNLGGFEGGMTNGMPIVVRGVMKPIPTLYKPLKSIDIDTKQVFAASIERSDSCAVPAASIVAEAVVAWELANEIVKQFGQDRMDLIQNNLQEHKKNTKYF
ncbi:chorismate synthase [Bacillus thuringiensis]|uniref:Chorismate synthase n=1 Tax=Bacillus thuringiensis TaxID=1428 RepID=A0A4R4B4Q4_BACTU|nr:chorismate synthase [Bacillus thuringiensis]TCW47574.1 chorismate synthase [Bacillus thuringiensis]TCW47730.1 chorismate synthase [Bacillus thuringiensis]